MIETSILFTIALITYVALLIRSERRLTRLEQTLHTSQLKSKLLRD